MEKAYAKINGNYEQLAAGQPSEAMKLLTNAPSFYYSLTSIGATHTWSLLVEGVTNGYFMSLGTSSGSDQTNGPYNLPKGHAYTVLQVITVTAQNGTTYKLVQIRNPWRTDNKFTGKWKD